MTEKHLFADVDLPFHVWVRERIGGRGYRWVLREAAQARDAAQAPRSESGVRPASREPSSD